MFVIRGPPEILKYADLTILAPHRTMQQSNQNEYAEIAITFSALVFRVE